MYVIIVSYMFVISQTTNESRNEKNITFNDGQPHVAGLW